jgi:hypothetical protein
MRVLFVLGHAGHVRNFESALRCLAQSGHDTVIVLDRLDGNRGVVHVEPLATLVAEHPDRLRVVVRRLPAWHPGSAPGVVLRALDDYLLYLQPDLAAAAAARRRAAGAAGLGQSGIPRVLRSHDATRRARAVLQTLDRQLPPRRAVRALLHAERPDVLVASPLIDLRSRQVEWLRAARLAGVPTLFPVASWDNLTSKGTLHDIPDRVTVWNDSHVREAVELHGIDEARIEVTGAVAFDHWFGWRPSASREELSARLGLEASTPYVLYLCSAPFVAPHEGAFVVDWATRVRSAGLRDAQIVMRPHPLATPTPEELRQLAYAGVTVFPHTTSYPADLGARNDYFDTIHHSAAVVGVNTSGFIEAAIEGRAGFSFLSNRYRDTQSRMPHFAHLLEENGGPVRPATSFEEHARHLRDAIDGIDARAPELRAFVERFIRPFGLDEPAAPRLVDAIERLG